MENQTERSQLYREQLTAFLRREYHFDKITLTPARRGFFGETWRIHADGLNIRREQFLGESADAFFRQWQRAKDLGILSLLEENRMKLEYRSDRRQFFRRF